MAAARAAGIDVVVTDHHSPRADGGLPDAPIVHPEISGYPCEDLCATAVAHKLVCALEPEQADRDLDLVALATIADCVPLRGENRRLVREGLAALRRTERPGLRALMRVADAHPGAVDEHTVAFRLAPRINASGPHGARRRRAGAAAHRGPAIAPRRSPTSSTGSTPSAATPRRASPSRRRPRSPSRASSPPTSWPVTAGIRA